MICLHRPNYFLTNVHVLWQPESILLPIEQMAQLLYSSYEKRNCIFLIATISLPETCMEVHSNVWKMKKWTRIHSIDLTHEQASTVRFCFGNSFFSNSFIKWVKWWNTIRLHFMSAERLFIPWASPRSERLPRFVLWKQQTDAYQRCTVQGQGSRDFTANLPWGTNRRELL